MVYLGGLTLRTVLCCLLLTLQLGCSSAQFPSDYGGCPAAVPNGPLPALTALRDVPAIGRALADMDAAIAHLIEPASIPSVSAAVVFDQQIMWSKGYGIFNSTIGRAPDLDTVYMTGSVGKLYTALLMMVARDKGLLHLDSPVSSLIPDFHFINPYEPASRGPTFQQLASHLSGVPSQVGLEFDVDPSNRLMFALLANSSLTVQPDTVPMYSNLGFSCLGNVVAELLNESYSDALQQLVLDPLGLKSTSTAYKSSFDGRMAQGWIFGVPVPAEDVTQADGGWFAPDGGHFTTARDLASLLSFFFRQDAAAGPGQIISGASIREMMLPRYIYPDRRSGFATPFELYWTADEQLLHTKLGDSGDGYSTYVLMSVPLKVGLVVLVNSLEEAPPVAQVAANLLFPAARAAVAAIARPYPLPPNFNSFLGQYQSQVEGSVYIVIIRGNADAGLHLDLLWSSPMNESNFLEVASAPLRWNGPNATFQVMPETGTEASCIIVSVYQFAFEWIYFDSITNPQSFVAPTITAWAPPFIRVHSPPHSAPKPALGPRAGLIGFAAHPRVRRAAMGRAERSEPALSEFDAGL